MKLSVTTIVENQHPPLLIRYIPQLRIEGLVSFQFCGGCFRIFHFFHMYTSHTFIRLLLVQSKGSWTYHSHHPFPSSGGSPKKAGAYTRDQGIIYDENRDKNLEPAF